MATQTHMEMRLECQPYITNRRTQLTLDEVLLILRKEDLDESRIITLPPVLPKGGEVYVYCPCSPEPKYHLDFRFDQYRWISKGSNFHRGRKHPPCVLKRYYYLKDPNGLRKDSLAGFMKHVYCLRELRDSRPRYVIHYLGDESLYQPSCHGNRKSSNKPFVGTMRQVFEEVESALELHKEPIKVYKNLQSTKSQDVSIKYMPVDRPVNLKQVQNVSYRQKQKKRVSNDEVFSIVELSVHLDSFVTKFMLLPDLTISFGHPDLIKQACVLLSLSSEDDSLPQLVSYDTTFKLGDFYLSPIVMRNITLKGDPVFPLAFLLHKKKFMSYHQDFLCEILAKLGPDNMKNIPFVTDRERGIVQPLQKNFPQIPNVYCRNHIMRDVSTWIKKHGGNNSDLKVLKDQIALLLNSESQEEYQHKYEQYSIMWSQPFKQYFDKELKDSIPKHAAKFFTQKFAAFRNVVTATNNISESINRVIKNELDWKEMPADCLVLAMYYMQTFFLYEFERANCGLGNYSLKDQFSYLQKTTAESQFPPFYALEAIVDHIKSSKPPPKKGVEKAEGYRKSQTSLAQLCIDSGGVALCPQSATFTVREVNSSKVQAVKLLPEPAVCSCASTGRCYHIIAAAMSIGYVEKADRQTYSLSTLLKKRKGRSQKSGRKKARVGDYDYSIVPAADSVLVSSQHEIAEFGRVVNNESILAISEIERTQIPGSPLQNALPKHSTPKAKGSLKQGEKQDDPWNQATTEMDRNLLNSIPSNITDSLKPGAWLCDEAIEEAISSFICQRNLNEKILICPTYIYTSVALGKPNIFYPFLDYTMAFNKDILLLPFNTDIHSTGLHWVLGVILFKTREIIIVDSAKDWDRSQRHGNILLSTAAACHQIAGVPFRHADWKIILSADTVQQNNSYDCGVYTVLNAYSVISGEEYGTLCSERARNWIGVTIGLHRNCKCRRNTKQKQFPGSYQKLHHQLLSIDNEVHIQEQPMLRYLLSLADKDTSRWSTCPEESCQGNFTPEDCMVFCCSCRQWYHAACLPSGAIKLPTYFICKLCMH